MLSTIFPISSRWFILGGPVDLNSLQYIHTLGDELPGSKEVLNGLYWGGDFDILKLRIEEGLVKPGQVKFFAGYSGWSAKQLSDEIDRDSWLVFEASLDYVMSEDEELWKHFLQDMGGEFKQMSQYPLDPRLN